jgi:predicted  nucleic acid-binding Zn-ribbon protein
LTGRIALTQACRDEEYRSALNENAALKKEKSKWRKEKQGLENKVVELESSTKQDFIAIAARDAELHNLKNAVARIPQDVWNTYTKPKAQQKNHQQEVL